MGFLRLFLGELQRKTIDLSSLLCLAIEFLDLNVSYLLSKIHPFLFKNDLELDLLSAKYI